MSVGLPGGVELLAERAVGWPAARTVLVSDLHWGKEETFHAAGMPVPSTLDDDLARLEAAVARVGATRILVLGDLIHGPLLPTTIERISTFRRRCAVALVLVRGNHDRHAPVLPGAWGVEEHSGVLLEGPFAFTHAPAPVDGHYTWAGHIHPMYTVRGRGDAVRLPCFHLGARVGVLPAFGAFTGGIGVRPERGDHIYVVADGQVVRVERPEVRARTGSRGYGR